MGSVEFARDKMKLSNARDKQYKGKFINKLGSPPSAHQIIPAFPLLLNCTKLFVIFSQFMITPHFSLLHTISFFILSNMIYHIRILCLYQ